MERQSEEWKYFSFKCKKNTPDNLVHCVKCEKALNKEIAFVHKCYSEDIQREIESIKPMSYSASIKITKSLAELLAIDQLNISTIYKQGFQNFLKTNFPKYELPDEDYFSTSQIPILYEDKKREIRKALCKAEIIFVVYDKLCTDRFVSRATVYWIDEDFNRREIIFSNFKEKTEVNAFLVSLKQSWNFPAKIITYNRLLLHDFFLYLYEIISRDAGVSKIIAKAKKLMCLLSDNKTNCKKSYFTVWGTQLELLETIFEEKACFLRFPQRNLSTTQWIFLEDTLNLLKSLENCTRKIFSEDFIASTIIPYLFGTLKTIEELDIFSINKLKSFLVEQIEFILKNTTEDKYHAISTFLDPRFKAQYFIENKEETVKGIVNVFLDADGKKRNSEVRNLEVEVDSYLFEDLLDRNCSPYVWWKEKGRKYPNLRKSAKNYLYVPLEKETPLHEEYISRELQFLHDNYDKH